MFGAFSRLFKKPDTSPAITPSIVKHATEPQRRESLSRTGTPEVSVPARVNAENPSFRSDDIKVPYSSIIKLLPTELWGKLAPAGMADCHLRIPRQFVVQQLCGGAVKIRFGEIRRFAPAGALISSDLEDSRLVNLPLGEIITQLDAGTFACRADQKHVVVPEDVPDVFGSQAFTAPLRVMTKREIATEFSGKSDAPLRVDTKPIQVSEDVSRRTQPVARGGYEPTQLKHLSIADPLPKADSSVGTVAAQQKRVLDPKNRKDNSIKLNGPLAQGSFTIGLDNVAENWPDVIRQELAQLKIPSGRIALPPIEVCEGLKRGRVQYPWGILKGWIQPSVEGNCSTHDETILELPLEKLTPVFLEFIRSNPLNRNSAAADNITEFFRRAEQSCPLADGAAESNSSGKTSVSTCPPSSDGDKPADPNVCAPISTTNNLGSNSKSLRMSLVTLTSDWPEQVLRDITLFKLENTSVDLPLELIEAGLKAGRVQFSWQELCSWLTPASSAALHSINGDVIVQLALANIAPHFLKLRATNGQSKQRQQASSDIPDIFSSNKGSVAREHLEPKTIIGPTPEVSGEEIEHDRQGPPTNLSQLFGEKAKATWTPNEIVQRATNLPGVIGAVIALQDGLLVASSLPPDVKTEMVAAFIPQIFGRLNQYSRELQLGCATSVAFTVEMGTLQIYNAGLIYFAALCRPGEAVPASRLQIIATELSRHTK